MRAGWGVMLFMSVAGCAGIHDSLSYESGSRIELWPHALFLAPGDTGSISAYLCTPTNGCYPVSAGGLRCTNPGLVTITGDGFLRSTGRTGDADLVLRISNVTGHAPIHVLAASTPAQRAFLPPFSPLPFAPAISHSTVLLGTVDAGGSGSLWRAEFPTLQLGKLFTGGPLYGVAFSSTGDRAFVVGGVYDGFSTLFLPGDSVFSSASGVLPGTPIDLIVSADDRSLFVIAGDNGFYSVPTDSLSPAVLLHRFPVTPTRIVAHPTDSTVYVSAGREVDELAIPDGTLLRTFPFDMLAQGLAVSPDGSRLYVADESGHIVIWNLRGSSTPRVIPMEGAPFGLTLSSNGQRLYIGAYSPGRVYVFDVSRGEFTGMYSVGGTPRRLTYSPDWQVALAPNEDGWLDVVE